MNIDELSFFLDHFREINRDLWRDMDRCVQAAHSEKLKTVARRPPLMSQVMLERPLLHGKAGCKAKSMD